MDRLDPGGLGLEGQIQALVVKLQSFDGGKIREAAGELLLLAKKGPHNRALIMRAGGLERLVQLLRNEAPPVRSAAAAVLWHMGQDAECCRAILHADGIKVLVQMLQSDIVEQLYFAAAALSMLVKNDTAAGSAVLNAEGVPLLAGLLQASHTGVQEHAAAALAGLADVSDDCVVGIVKQLLQLITTSSSSTTTQKAVAVLHDVLASNTARAAAFEPASSSATLVDLLATAAIIDDVAVKCSLVRTVFEVCKANSSNAQSVTTAGAAYVAQLLSSSDPQLQQAAGALVQLSCGVGISNGAAAALIPPLMQLLGSSNAVTQATAAAALQQLAVNTCRCGPELQASCIKQLLTLQHGNPHDTEQHTRAVFLSLVDADPVGAIQAAAAAQGLCALLGCDDDLALHEADQLRQTIVDALPQLGSSERASTIEQIQNIQWLAPLAWAQLPGQGCKPSSTTSGTNGSYGGSGSSSECGGASGSIGGSVSGSNSGSGSSHGSSGDTGDDDSSSTSNSSNGGTSSSNVNNGVQSGCSTPCSSAFMAVEVAESDATSSRAQVTPSAASAAGATSTSSKRLVGSKDEPVAVGVNSLPVSQTLTDETHMPKMTEAAATMGSQPHAAFATGRMIEVSPATTVQKADAQTETAVQVTAQETQTDVSEALSVWYSQLDTNQLVKQLESQDSAQQAAAAAEVARRASKPEQRRALHRANAIPALTGMLRSAPVAAQHGANWPAAMVNATAALCHFACDASTIEDIHKTCGCQQFVKALKQQDSDLQQLAAAALASLAASSETEQNGIRHARGIPALLQLLKPGAGSDSAVQKMAATALANSVAGNAESQQAVLDSQGVPPLLDMLQVPDMSLQRSAAIALANVAAGDRARLEDVKVEGIRTLLALLSSRDAVVQISIATALHWFASADEGIAAEVLAGASTLTPLHVFHQQTASVAAGHQGVSTAAAGHQEVSTAAAGQQGVAKAAAAGQRTVAKAAAGQQGVAKAAAAGQRDVAKAAAGQQGVVEAAAGQQGAVKAAAGKQSTAGVPGRCGTDARTGQQAIGDTSRRDQLQNSLQSMHAHTEASAAVGISQSELTNPQQIASLISQFSSLDPCEQASAAAMLMHCIADGRFSTEAIYEAGGVEPLVLLLGSRSPQVQKCAAAAIGIVAKGGPNVRNAILSSCGLGLLLGMVGEPVEELQLHATAALLELVGGDADFILELHNADGVPQLVPLLGSRSRQVQQNTLAILSCIVPVAYEAVLEARALEPLVRLALGADEAVGELAQQVLGLLSSCGEDIRQAVHDAGVAMTDSVK